MKVYVVLFVDKGGNLGFQGVALDKYAAMGMAYKYMDQKYFQEMFIDAYWIQDPSHVRDDVVLSWVFDGYGGACWVREVEAVGNPILSNKGARSEWCMGWMC